MCGIAGVYNLKKQKVDYSLVAKMVGLLAHRGPDDEGFFIKENIGLGHRRLSIIDLSERGHQPMEREGLVIVYNGEIYNYIELRKELEEKGYVFSSATDTEVILFAFKEWGKDCLKKFNGMWAFAIWNKEKKELFCSRDRYGIKPFYYYYNDNVFLFASEIKPLLLFKKEPDKKSIYHYLTAELADFSENTFFKDIKQLEPGRYLILKDSTLKIDKYYELGFNRSLGSFSEKKLRQYSETFLGLLEDSVKLRLRSDVEIGSCLSGGLDSSAIVCLIDKLKKIKQKTFSFYAEAVDEREYIQEIVREKDINFFYVSSSAQEFWKDLEKVVFCQEEPFKSSGIYAQYKVMKLAKKNNIKVLLDGQGADELFGYPEQIGSFLNQSILHARFPLKFNKTILSNYLRFFLPKSAVFYLRKKKIKGLNFLNFSFEKEYKYEEGISRFSRINYQQALFEGITKSGLRRLLKYEDRNSMANSIESRLPFLDYRLVDFVFSLPAVYKIGKLLQREALKSLIPEKVRTRKDKMGFATPEENWLKENKENITNLFKSSDFKSEEYIENKKVLKNIEKINLSELWRFINLELWLRKF
ncbi:hypothetical protein AMJ47_00350 [Parcubacteria bacterium DG_72]|nr:MAG: hypothetical protein AMJ47_00350 [Parcubacteria bacterium DG_72]